MDRLPSDILRLFADPSLLSIRDIIQFSRSCKKTIQSVYNSEQYWRKLSKERLTEHPDRINRYPLNEIRHDLASVEDSLKRKRSKTYVIYIYMFQGRDSPLMNMALKGYEKALQICIGNQSLSWFSNQIVEVVEGAARGGHMDIIDIYYHPKSHTIFDLMFPNHLPHLIRGAANRGQLHVLEKYMDYQQMSLIKDACKEAISGGQEGVIDLLIASGKLTNDIIQRSLESCCTIFSPMKMNSQTEKIISKLITTIDNDDQRKSCMALIDMYQGLIPHRDHLFVVKLQDQRTRRFSRTPVASGIHLDIASPIPPTPTIKYENKPIAKKIEDFILSTNRQRYEKRPVAKLTRSEKGKGKR